MKFGEPDWIDQAAHDRIAELEHQLTVWDKALYIAAMDCVKAQQNDADDITADIHVNEQLYIDIFKQSYIRRAQDK
jgi:hypothetical protein